MAKIFADIDASKSGKDEFKTYDNDAILGKPFPDVSALKAINPEAFGAPKPGQVCVFYVWAQYHKPGYQKFPLYSKLAEKYGDAVCFVALSIDPNTEGPTKFWNDPAKKYHKKASGEFNANFAHAWDDGRVKKGLMESGRVITLSPPHAYVVDAKGIIRWHQDHSEQIGRESCRERV